jgi:hypothetical protein
MNLHCFARRAGASAALVGVSALVAGAGAAPADVSSAGSSAPVIGPKGVGAVKIGKRYETLRRQNLIGKIRPGCELGGPNTRSAKLKSPLKGSVDFTQKSPRKLTNVTVFGGAATAKGVGIGATIDEITAAYPHAKVDHGSDEVFQVTFVTIPKADGGKFQFAVEVDSGKTTAIGVPFIATCE